MSDGLIDPDAIPLPISLANLVVLESAADSLKEDGESIAERAHDIKSSWSGLQGLYQAPEAEALFAVLDPVPTDGDSVKSALSTVSTALTTFTERARELRSEMVSLKTRAHVFLASIEGDDDWDEGGLLGGENPKVTEHNDLLNEVTRIQTDYMEAERECANTITALFDGPVFVPMNADGSHPPSGNEIGYGLSEAPENLETDWGTPQGTDHHWYVDAAHGFGEWTAGVAIDFAGMTGMYYEGQWGVPVFLGPLAANPWTNPQGTANAQNYGQDMAVGLMYLSGFYTGEAPPRIEAERSLFRSTYAWELDGWTVPQSPGEWWENAGPAWTELVQSTLRWDEWEDRPGYAATQIGLDVGAGAATGGALKALQGLRAVGRGDFDLSGVDSNPMDGTLEFGDRPQGGAPSPTDFGALADRSTDSEALDSLDSTLDELAAHQNSVPTGPVPDAPGTSDTADTSPLQEAPEQPAVPSSPESASSSSEDQPDTAEVPSPERTEAPEPELAGRPEQDDAESAAPDPTTREAQEELIRAEMVRNDPELREILEGIDADLPERVDSMDPDAPWTASPVREPEMAMAGTGGGGGGGSGGPLDTPTGGTGHTHVDTPGTGSGGGDGDGPPPGDSGHHHGPPATGDGLPDSPQSGADAPGEDIPVQPKEGVHDINPSDYLPGGSLQANEYHNGTRLGHTLERHVGVSEHYLRQRTLQNPNPPGIPFSGKVSGRYKDLESAELATATAIKMREQEISEWLISDPSLPENRSLVLRDIEVNLGEIGFALERQGSKNNPTGWIRRDPQNIRLLLRYHPEFDPPYYVHTSFPTPAPNPAPGSSS